ncbi:MAG TPA: asparagine synthase (glutamine-hydrolyzing) [Allosphingosinicella sp.]|nr:asparagine synthase (glutamine-hydrolyzing) [Allosphingosinicella sp.]
MCGITGFWTKGGLPGGAHATLHRLTSAIAHRGPDDQGAWFDDEAGLALGHRRLSIIDLSPAGHQPMASASGRYVLTYNGEIYNYRELRAELEALGAVAQWRGHSDTEVMLAAVERWGVAGALERLNGMFAFALWDKERRTLTLARDRMGEKPLYYGRMGETFLFGSELKALAGHPEFSRDVNRDALASYLRYNCVPSPASIWRGISKLPPGCSLEVSGGGTRIGHPVAYWDLKSAAAAGSADPLPLGPELADNLDLLLRDSVLKRMESDVPLGAFLSGGIDSSLIVALMQAQSARPVRTFTIGFHEQSHNEAGHAKAIADHLGTDHTELYVTAADALDVIPRLPAIWDEPFSDSSQIPTYLVSALTRQHVTVSLSGDGGDELFGGYNRYVQGMRLWELGSRLGPQVKRILAGLIRSRGGISAASALMKLAPPSRRHLGIADRMPKIADAFEARSAEALYTRLVSHFDEPEALVIGGREQTRPLEGQEGSFRDFREMMMYADSVTYLPDDILVKVDRASMAVSLEARVPFLDHRVVEYAWRVPIEAKIRDGRGKRILRDLLYRYVPEALVERPKAGFGIPLGDWLNGPLRDWAEDLLDPRRLRDDGYLEPGPVRQLWDEQLRRGGRHHLVWDVLMFQAWLAEQKQSSAMPAAPPAAPAETVHA